MGDTMYYLKAKFPTKDYVDLAYWEIKKLIAQGLKAEEWFDDHRDMDPAIFWKEFSALFPLVTRSLGKTEHYDSIVGGEYDNAVAHFVNYGDGDYNLDSLMVNDDELWYCAYVWHFADWGRFADMFYAIGATDVRFVSEEDANMFDLINFDKE
jgi:hypothetical protein